MNEQALRFRVGMFVLASMILLAVLVILFSGLPSLFKPQDTYTILFSDAKGVSAGTPVRKSGVRIGEVQSFRLDNETGEVVVTIVIERAFTLRENDIPTLVRGLIGGDTSIDFLPKQEDPDDEAKRPVPGVELAAAQPPGKKAPAPVVPPGSVLRGVDQSDAQKLVGEMVRIMPTLERSFRRFDQMGPEIEKTVKEFGALAKESRGIVPEVDKAIHEFQGLAKDSRESIPAIRRTNDELLVAARYWARVGERLNVFIQTNQDKVVRALDSFNDTITRIGNVFNDENQKNLAGALKNMRSGTDSLDRLTKNTDEFVKESRNTLKTVNDSVKQTDEVLNNLARATKPMAERSAAVMHNLDESTNKLNKLMQESRELLRMFSSDGSFRSFLTDPALYNNLNDTACMIARMMPRIDRALRDVELFADKIARHPESLGVGGAIRPGSGMKK